MITILFSSSKKPGSLAISAGTWLLEKECRKFFPSIKDTPSHVAVRYQDLVIESTFTTGIRVISYKDWLKINNPLYAIEIKVDDHLYNNNLINLFGKKYDWLGILYFATRLILPLAPRENKWQDSDRYFCTEFAASFLHPKFRDLSPGRFYIEMLKWKIG